jgi:sulfur-oxidizing protein SoxY
VKALLLLVEKNPVVLVAKFDVNESVEPSFALRSKMAETSSVYAVALTNDNKAFFARRQVQVTIGGCG